MTDIPLLDPDLKFFEINGSGLAKDLKSWYSSFDISEYHQFLDQQTGTDWQHLGSQKSIKLFKQAAEYVPAYKDFLKKNGVNPNEINSLEDFQSVPQTDKSNYISQYEINELCWNGTLDDSDILSFSSGSTGEPYFWPRNVFTSIESQFFVEDFLVRYFGIDKCTSLFVNCYSMGAYVAGTYMLSAVQQISQKGYRLTLVSPGINYHDTFRLVSRLSKHYDQTILCGYPPFIKDIIDLGPEFGVDWSKINLKFFLGSEFYSESWRGHLLDITDTDDLLNSSTNLYGAADASIFGFETPATIALKKLSAQSLSLHTDLFQTDLTPTFIQYNPALRYFETIDGELAVTAISSIPLIRYNLKDKGGILSQDLIDQKLILHTSTSFENFLKDKQISEKFQKLPFLFIQSRSDGAISFYAILIFPEYIRSGIETKKLEKSLSGKFSMSTVTDENHDPVLVIHLELNPEVHVSTELESQVRQSIIKSLRKRCHEFSFLENSIGDKAYPRIHLHPKGESEYFKIGIKQRWIAK